ncbi:hypothetical protein [Pseudonocardia sp.]|jgi:hypothetical protein|uniref:hypothetical protein n=1 Tax=Pseudonocardia sp. TaxID=60912 RepID=UPI002613F9C7|nr:hypothetical protein [Pseudonocardia sp.]MCW2722658.1 hypothetical protein [Pseudonocardia sp.]MDT7618854.1 hypothetical protein [Pseudonocardiales bacterium]
MGGCWSEVFRRGEWGAAVFEVAPGNRGLVRDWAQRQRVPTASPREMHMPDVDAWAVLDGGITSIYGYGLTSLPCGIRVVGFQVFRLLLAELDLAGPVLPFDGETVLDPDELRLRHHSPQTHGPAAMEQAELLGACRDAVLLRWVAATLAASP